MNRLSITIALVINIINVSFHKTPNTQNKQTTDSLILPRYHNHIRDF